MTSSEPAKLDAARGPDVFRSAATQVLSRLGPLIGLILVAGAFAIAFPKFRTAGNAEVMLLQTAIVITAGLGMTMIIISGGIDLSVGSNVAMCSVVVAMLLKAGFAPMSAAAGGIAAGMASGLVIGSLVTLLRLQPFIVTLGMWGALRGLAKWLADDSVVFIADRGWLDSLLVVPSEKNRWMLVAPGLWLTLLLAVLVAGVFRYTRFGRHLFAIGSNEQTARLCGVRVNRTKIAVYASAGALAGIAGVLQFAYVGLGDPTGAAGMELDVIAAVVIGGASLSGGVGTVSGTIIGALLMTVVANGLTKFPDMRNSVQQIVTGTIIVIAAALDRLRRGGRA
ncbi:ABC transporter permease [Humisphaera borealis]|uniref:ABC transporter permease n=1 Tax=Humisphaera borealis TaxID=2807512 RepID=A0A7M2X1T4_9BACT|nr:ABC transporter permease [Humisphaera borealis]QOV91635.1 ABC transporter permease [Humisphaera borealis]